MPAYKFQAVGLNLQLSYIIVWYGWNTNYVRLDKYIFEGKNLLTKQSVPCVLETYITDSHMHEGSVNLKDLVQIDWTLTKWMSCEICIYIYIYIYGG